jgi:predicted phosphodiesterase
VRPSQAELETLRETHGSVDRVAAALGLSRSEVRAWYQTPHLRLAPEDGLSHAVEDTEIPVITHDFSHLDSLRVYAMGDVHKGAGAHQRDRWREWVGYLRTTPGTAMIGTGDFLNAGIIGSKSDPYEERMTVGEAKRELRSELKPIADKILVMVPGNHDWRVFKAVGDCPVQDLADSLECPYARSAALLRLIVGDIEYQFYLRHGTGNGRSLAQIDKSALVFPFADVHISGHTHRPAVYTDEYFVAEGDRVVRRQRHFTVSGSFLGYERYAAERGYTPSRIGAPRIRLDGRARDVKVSL